jgi:hypothetical protein
MGEKKTIISLQNFHLYHRGITSIILMGIGIFLLLLVYPNPLILKADAQTLNFSPDTEFAPLQSTPQTPESFLNGTMQVQQQLQKQIQTISNLSSQDVQKELQRKSFDIQRSEQELQQNQRLLPQLSSQRGQQILISQLQTLQQLISLPPEQQQQELSRQQQLLNLSKQTAIQQQMILQASEQQLQTLQQLISLPPEQQQKILKNMQQLLMPREGLQ